MRRPEVRRPVAPPGGYEAPAGELALCQSPALLQQLYRIGQALGLRRIEV